MAESGWGKTKPKLAYGGWLNYIFWWIAKCKKLTKDSFHVWNFLYWHNHGKTNEQGEDSYQGDFYEGIYRCDADCYTQVAVLQSFQHDGVKKEDGQRVGADNFYGAV